MGKNLLEKYYDPKFPGSYSGFNSFFKNKKLKTKKIKEIKEKLLESDSYTLHRPTSKKFLRNKIIVSGVDQIWQIDLIDIKKFSKENDNYKYLLTCIDVFSKYAWVKPLIDKSGQTVLEALQEIFKERIPNKIHADEGKEFFNKKCNLLFNKLNIRLYHNYSEMKASIIERFNRTLKEKIWRYFTHKNTNRYIDVINDLVLSYNNTYHRTIKTSPSKVNKYNEKSIWKNIYGYKNIEEMYNDIDINFKFKVGDKVRISKNKNIFKKGYEQNWSYEIFTISDALPRVPPVYIIKDYNNEIIQGIFYENELQKVYKSDEIYKIEQIIKEKISNKKKYYFVKWLGYPDSFNSWILASDIQ